MKPHRIILIRHGECHANTDESKFATEPDYTIELTEKGVAQAVKPDKS
ncbi:phosphoglycerate mutase family protein [Phocaeicola plebeius]|nr:phosphoglycerate mutase family protein [Phocaeicola plebeius]